MKELYKISAIYTDRIFTWISNNSIIYNMLITTSAFFCSLFSHIYMFIVGVLVLVFIDTHLGIKAAQRLKIPFSSKVRRKGLLDKANLYLIIITVTVVLDTGMLQIYAVKEHIITMIILFFILLYEGTSIVEKLKTIHPNSQIVNTLAKLFKILGDKTEEKVTKEIEEINDIIKKSKE